MKTAIVTGAARGIGLATTKRFIADGWAVAMLDPSFKTVMAGLPTAMRDPAGALRDLTHEAMSAPVVDDKEPSDGADRGSHDDDLDDPVVPIEPAKPPQPAKSQHTEETQS